MTETNYTWETRDKKQLFARSWQGDKIGKFTILLVHGLGEHSGRYEHWAQRFIDKGFNMLSFDLRGHGKSEGQRGHVKKLDLFLDDIDLMFDKAKELYPDSGLILYGHSMGGNLVLNHIIKRNRPIEALVVTSPWLKLTNPPASGLIAIVEVLKKFLPFVSIPNGLNPEDISHDPEVIRNYPADPLNHNKISLKLFYEIHEAGLFALRNVYKINYPFLLMHGTADNITSPKASENYVMNTTTRTHLKLWEGQYHELHNEFIKDEVFEYIISWLTEYKIS
jgi:alpha-beta hydrolase superfamily lysophospholipase